MYLVCIYQHTRPDDHLLWHTYAVQTQISAQFTTTSQDTRSIYITGSIMMHTVAWFHPNSAICVVLLWLYKHSADDNWLCGLSQSESGHCPVSDWLKLPPYLLWFCCGYTNTVQTITDYGLSLSESGHCPVSDWLKNSRKIPSIIRPSEENVNGFIDRVLASCVLYYCLNHFGF